MTSRTLWRRIAHGLAGAALAALAACGGGGAGTSADESAHSTALECRQQNYPCRWAEVEPAVAERSNELGDQIAARLDGGASTAEAVAWLRAQATLAELQFDDAKIRFRLAGGRAVWAAKPGSMSAPDDAAAPPPAKAPATAAPEDTTRSKALGVIRPGATQRHALVLAPFAFELPDRQEDTLAALLQSMPDYSGNVRLRQNLAATDDAVNVHEFRGWEAYDVVFVHTHGGEICWDEKTGLPYHECKASIAAQVSTNPVIDAIEDDNVGVELIKYENASWLLLTTDFFRHEYPQGLNDRLVYFLTCSGWNPQFAAALAGATGVYASWTGTVRAGYGQWVAHEMFELLAAGLDMREVLELMGSDLQQSPGVALHATDRSLRIRDLISVSDAYTSLPLSDDSGIEVGLRAGDGEPDHLLLELVIDGIRPEIAQAYQLDVALDGRGLMSVPVGVRATQIGEFRWKLPLEVPLGIDAQPGQRLPLQFSMRLPGWGLTLTQAAPRVNEPIAVEAERWSMTSTTVQTLAGGTTTKVANVIWQLEPGTSPDARYRYFRVQSGTLAITHQSDIAGCRLVYEASVDLEPGEANNSLKFDTAANPPLFSGFGNARARTIVATRVCEDGSSTAAEYDVGGVYLYAKDLAMSGSDSFMGTYHDGAQLPTQISFQFTRLR